MAAKYDTSMAELIRRAVDNWLQQSGSTDREELKRRALTVAGQFNSGHSDISTEHDRYLAEAFGE
jgi:hypothetical protein